MKYKLEFPFRTISGVMDRQIDRHGNVRTLIARKDGTMYWRTDYAKRNNYAK